MKEKFDVTGMTCSACSSHVEKSVSGLNGVDNVAVNLLTNSMQVEFNPEMTGTDKIIQAVIDAGYGASVKGVQEKAGKDSVSQAKKDADNMKKRLIVSIVFLIPLMYVSMGHMIYDLIPGLSMPQWEMNVLHGDANAITFAFTQLLLLIPILFANQKYFKNGFKTLINKSPNMDSLIAIGAGAAVLYGIFAIYRIGYGLGHGDMALVAKYSHDIYFESAGTILTLITVGKYLESRSKKRTSEAITKLMDLAPKTALVIREGRELTIPVGEMIKGDIFIVKPGEMAPVDGVIIDGKTSFDESCVTGESIPVLKQEGDNIISASINKSGLVKAKAVKVGEDTTISQIIRLVEEASQSKAPIAKLADKIALIFVPTVITIAILVGIIWLLCGAEFEFAMSVSIAVLVISCPCALGLATPVAIMVGTGKGAENGILIKSGEALESAHLTDTIVLDKTGTITEGKPVVTDIFTVEGRVSSDELLYIAGTLEKGSEHPLAEAVINKCSEKNISVGTVSEFNAVFGKGIEGSIDGTMYFAGNEKLMEEKSVPVDDKITKLIHEYAANGKTPLIFADNRGIIGIIAAADVVKTSSREAVKKMKDMGIHVIMLTGDNQITANAIKDQVGIDEVIAGVLPHQKEEKISQLKNSGHNVAMIGDGVNDAPALASAHTGIAIGAGTDVAIDSADIVLMKSDLMDAVNAIKLSKAVIKNIRENLFWAFFYNIIGIPVAAGILYPLWQIKLNPMIGAAAMSLSSVCVVSNALRLKRLKLQGSQQVKEPDLNADSEINIKNNLESEREEISNMRTATISIEGMACAHCTGRVEKALTETAGVSSVKVSLEEKNAVVTVDDSVSDETLKSIVTEAGYEVTEIK